LFGYVGQASRAVDGDVDQTLHRCIALDNFYTERPTLKIDLGRRTLVTGLIIVTWQGKGQGMFTMAKIIKQHSFS